MSLVSFICGGVNVASHTVPILCSHLSKKLSSETFEWSGSVMHESNGRIFKYNIILQQTELMLTDTDLYSEIIPKITPLTNGGFVLTLHIEWKDFMYHYYDKTGKRLKSFSTQLSKLSELRNGDILFDSERILLWNPVSSAIRLIGDSVKQVVLLHDSTIFVLETFSARRYSQDFFDVLEEYTPRRLERNELMLELTPGVLILTCADEVHTWDLSTDTVNLKIKVGYDIRELFLMSNGLIIVVRKDNVFEVYSESCKLSSWTAASQVGMLEVGKNLVAIPIAKSIQIRKVVTGETVASYSYPQDHNHLCFL